MKYISVNVPANHLTLWSDPCGGQNRSIKLVLIMAFTLQCHLTSVTISIKFLYSGHSFLPNGSEFGDAECALKTHERLYAENDYIRVMKLCRRSKKFEVISITKQDIFSYIPLENITQNRYTWRQCQLPENS